MKSKKGPRTMLGTPMLTGWRGKAGKEAKKGRPGREVGNHRVRCLGAQLNKLFQEASDHCVSDADRLSKMRDEK